MKRQVMPEDLGITPKQEGVTIDLITDGKILKQNLLSIKKDEEWLKKELNKQGIMKIKNIFLAIYDNEQNLSVYIKTKSTNTYDEFQ